MKKIIISTIAIFSGVFSGLNAQQIPLYSNYFFTPYIYNPAQSGTSGATEVSAMYRQQWSALQGSPQTAAIALNGNIGSDNVGYSVYGFNDEAGVIQNYGFYGAYAYHLQLSENNFLSFGLAGGFLNSGLNRTAIRTIDPSDPNLAGDFRGRGIFDINTGLNLRIDKFQIGVAVPQLLGSPVRFLNQPDDQNQFRTVRHFMFNTQYDFEIQSDRAVLSPMVMVRAVPNAPIMVDAGALLNLKGLGFVGAMYRSDYAVTGNLGFHINDQLTVGYAYDFSINDYSSNLGTSQEIMLTWRFGSNSKVDRLENEVKRMRQMDRRRGDDMEKTIEEKMEEIRDQLKRDYEKAKEEAEGDADAIREAAQRRAAEQQRQQQQQSQQGQQGQTKTTGSDDLSGGTTASKVKAGDKGFYVTAGVFGSEANANRRVSALKDKGFDAGVFHDPGNNMYYVFLYKFSSYKEANKARTGKLNGKYDGDLWIKVVE
ncbi:MAG: PorP/SprF family type IX secretion system membrane protein [Cryomorphaceae bacterium]|nr:PorP/SprF family type IX secretion system membrane protein [Cryomorphaceae bacterium]